MTHFRIQQAMTDVMGYARRHTARGSSPGADDNQAPWWRQRWVADAAVVLGTIVFVVAVAFLGIAGLRS